MVIPDAYAANDQEQQAVAAEQVGEGEHRLLVPLDAGMAEEGEGVGTGQPVELVVRDAGDRPEAGAILQDVREEAGTQNHL